MTTEHTESANGEVIDLESKHALGDIVQALNESEFRKHEPSPEYKQRHITTLKAVSQWTAEEIENHKNYNRLFQKGYSSIEPDRLIQLAVITKEDWLTDWICPQIGPASKLNIAADLIAKYQISSDDLNEKTQEIYKWIGLNAPDLLKTTEQEINLQVAKGEEEIKRKAQLNLEKKYPDLKKMQDEGNMSKEQKKEYQTILEAFVQVETERTRVQITHELLRHAIEPVFDNVAQQLNLNKKPTYNKGENKDYAFLGAAGSGKSTIANQYLSNQDRLESVVLATDDYRGIVMDEHDEKIPTDQVFIRTQDTAYCIKELVQKRLESNTSERPNIILDCVTLEYWHKKLLATNNNKTVSALACLDDISLVPGRAYARAMDEKSGPADRGRQVNTTSLLSGHRDASARLLGGLPDGVKSTLYDTNVQRGAKPPSFAVVDLTTGKHKIEVTNLTKLSNFVCKANVNIEAQFPDQLFRRMDNQSYTFTFDRHHQAEQVLNLIKSKPHPTNPHWSKPAYEMVLQHNGQQFAKIVERDGKLNLEVLNLSLFREKWHNQDADARALRAIAMQIHWGSISEVRKNIKDFGSENRAEAIAIAALSDVVTEYLRPSENIPPYILNIMSSSEAPNLEELTKRFNRTADGKIMPNTMIPMLIKDDNNKIWVYGRGSNGAPQLNEIKNIEKYASISFPVEKGQPNKLPASNNHQAIYNDLASSKTHYYNYQVLVTDEAKRRAQEAARLDAEFMRQYKEYEKTQMQEAKHSQATPKEISHSDASKRQEPVLMGSFQHTLTESMLPAVKDDVLGAISEVKPVQNQSPALREEKAKFRTKMDKKR